MVNQLDAEIAVRMNSWVGKSEQFDSAMAFVASSELLKGVAFIALLWWYWFRSGDVATVRRTREHLVSTLLAGVLGIVVARGLAIVLPFRVRPRFEPELHFVSVKSAGDWFVDWSGFPSDHAVLFAALAIGLGFVSRRTGIVAFLYALIVIMLPRMYLGYHYLTDILAGLAIGGLMAYGLNSAYLRARLAAPAMRWEQWSPSSFYVALFVISFEIATLFNSLRDLAVVTVHFAEKLLK